MYGSFKEHLENELQGIKEAGLYKTERVITTSQSTEIGVGGRTVLNFCANNYLGIANDPRLVKAAHNTLEKYAFGMSSVRFICGTLDLHKALEAKISEFAGTEDCILYSSCFDANGGLFETLLGPEDAVISDQLNHASIIDGVRLCKAKRYRYNNNDMANLEQVLQETEQAGVRYKMICTDGVFSMDGIIANLKGVCDLADKYNALVMVDDSHATGFVGKTGRGTHEYNNVMGRVDVITSTLGKAMGGASGGYTTGRKEIIQLLRQRSRPYLFSNTLAPVITGTTIEVLNILMASSELVEKLQGNSARFRNGMAQVGFKLAGAGHPIVPVMLGDAKLASMMADDMLKEGIYVIGFSYPVVPTGQARIRVQLSAAHSFAQIDRAIEAFTKVGRTHGVIK
jgi:glycine C-acetyltransferase